MASGPWKIYAAAKKSLGNGTIKLGIDTFKMQLHRASASAALLGLSTRSTAASIPGEISATGGYVAGGRALVPATGFWGPGASAKQIKFSYSTVGLVFTASGAALSNIKYAILKNSAGKIMCFCTLSTAAFSINSPNTVTVAPHASGVFYLS